MTCKLFPPLSQVYRHLRAHKTTFNSNNSESLFSGSVSLIVEEQFYPTLLLRALIVHTSVQDPLQYFRLLWLGSSSCCMTQFQSSFSFHTDGLTFGSRILWYMKEFPVDSVDA